MAGTFNTNGNTMADSLPTAATPYEIYYPSVAVNFRIRFDEAFALKPTNIDGQDVGDMPAQTQQNPPPSPQGTTGISADNLSGIFARVPKSASVEMAGYRLPGKFSMTFDYKDFPIDPRLLRNVGVDIYIGSVRPSDFSSVMLGTNQGKSIDAGKVAFEESNLYMVGLIDSMVVNHKATSSEVTFDGRDLRGILLDIKMTASSFVNLDLSKPIQNVVQQILSLQPLAGGIPIQIIPGEWGIDDATAITSTEDTRTFQFLPLPIPGDAEKLTAVNQGLVGQNNKVSSKKKPRLQAAGDSTQISFWDLITKYCFLVGAIPHFVGRNLRISPVKSLYDIEQRAGKDPAIQTPFAGGKVRNVDDQQGKRPVAGIRELIYGKNILDLSFERRYAGTKVPTVRVVCLDTSSQNRGTQKLLTGDYPNDNAKDNKKKVRAVKNAKQSHVTPSGGAAMQEVLVVPYHGIADVGVLEQIAQAIYEEIGHHEMGGSCTTKSLASLGGSNSDPDLLHLLPGDPIRIMFDAQGLRAVNPIASEANGLQRKSFEDKVKYIAQKVGDNNLARVIVATAQNMVQGLQDIFRVKVVKFGWSNTAGINIAFDFENYVEVRSKVADSIGPNLIQPLQQGATPISTTPINTTPGNVKVTH